MRPDSSDSSVDIEFMRRAELFAGLLDDDLRYLATRASFLSIPPRARLFRPGDAARRFFIVREGSLRVFRTRFDGGEDEMALFAPGDALGDFDFARGAVYDASAEAVTDSTVLVFPGEGHTLESLVLERPDVSARLKLRSLAMLASRLRSTNKLISENAPWVRELRRRAYEDPGTGLWSRAFLDEEVSRTLKAPTALVLLKPDRFKLLVDERGHAAGDEAMARIAAVLKDLVRRLGRGWAIRVRSNETALVVPRCPEADAEDLARTVHREIAAIDPFPAEDGFSGFDFSVCTVYAVWPDDGPLWPDLFAQTYEFLLAEVKAGGDRVARAGKAAS